MQGTSKHIIIIISTTIFFLILFAFNDQVHLINQACFLCFLKSVLEETDFDDSPVEEPKRDLQSIELKATKETAFIKKIVKETTRDCRNWKTLDYEVIEESEDDEIKVENDEENHKHRLSSWIKVS